MNVDKMKVRLPDGTIEERAVDFVTQVRDLHGKPLGEPLKDPVLNEGEELVRVCGDPIPKIVKIE